MNSEEKIQELQNLEQNLQNFLMQKQIFQMELTEVTNALEEIKTSDEEIYKIVGNIMLKTKKDSINKELEGKKQVLDLRISSLEKQEGIIEDKVAKLRKEISENLNKQ